MASGPDVSKSRGLDNHALRSPLGRHMVADRLRLVALLHNRLRLNQSMHWVTHFKQQGQRCNVED
jgi:hypothetical protein